MCALNLMKLNNNIEKYAKNFVKELDSCDSMRHEDLRALLESSFADKAEEMLKDIKFDTVYKVFFSDVHATPKGKELKKIFISGSELRKKSDKIKISIFSVFTDLLNIILIRVYEMLEQMHRFLLKNHQAVMQDIKEKAKNKKLKKGEYEIISSSNYEEKKDKTEDINVKHFDYVMSKVEIKNFMKRFMGDSNTTADSGKQTEVSSWDPN